MKVVYPHALRPIAPFEKPVQAITTPITDTDNVLLCVDRAWLPVLRGAIAVLIEPVHWKGTEEDIDYAIEQIHQLIGMTEMGSCECVLACIQNNEDIIQEIIDKQYGDPDKPLSDEILGNDWIDGLGCDKDGLWAACQYVIDGIFDATTEILQRIGLATTPFEGLAKMTDDIPIVGFLTNAGDLLHWVTEVAYDAWFAADSQAVRDEMACELLCYAEANCAINMDMVELVFSRHAVKLWLDPLDLVEMVEWFEDIIFSGNPAKDVCSTIGMLGVKVIRHGGKFGEWIFNIRSLEQMARIGFEHNPNSSWSILCTTCDFYMWVKFDDPDDGDFELIEIPGASNTSIYYNEFGNRAPCIEDYAWHDTIGGQYQWDVHIKIPLTTAGDPTEINFDWYYQAHQDGQTYLGFKYYDANDNLLDTYYYSPTLARDTWHTAKFTGMASHQVSYIVIDVSRSSSSPQPTWSHFVDNVKVWYS